jgi:hypothetical protein
MLADLIWLVVSTPLKNIKVSWDDDIPKNMEKQKFNVPNQQPVVDHPSCETQRISRHQRAFFRISCTTSSASRPELPKKSVRSSANFLTDQKGGMRVTCFWC